MAHSCAHVDPHPCWSLGNFLLLFGKKPNELFVPVQFDLLGLTMTVFPSFLVIDRKAASVHSTVSQQGNSFKWFVRDYIFNSFRDAGFVNPTLKPSSRCLKELPAHFKLVSTLHKCCFRGFLHFSRKVKLWGNTGSLSVLAVLAVHGVSLLLILQSVQTCP